MTSPLIRYRVLWFVLSLALVLVGCEKGDDQDTSSGESALEALQVIEDQVSELRGLETRESVQKALLTTAELRQKMVEEFEEDYSEQEAHDDVLLYVAFDLMDPDIDLYDLLIDLHTEQTGGFYDPDTEAMYVVKRDEEPGAFERWVFSHEYTHVLQDQHFDLQALGFTDEVDGEDEDSERQFAIRSLVEGDASLLMQQYVLQYFDTSDFREALSESEEIDMSVFDAAPEILRESLVFPQSAGLVFVTALFQEGGWSAVDAAYADPPLSTEQILHPERYPDDVPQVVSLPPLTDTLGGGWRLVDEGVMGEFGLGIYLDVYLDSSIGYDDDLVENATEGWGGDRYVVHWREDESAFVLVVRLAWDTYSDADEFFDAYAQFAANRFGDDPARSEGDKRLWWFGDDALLLARNSQDETLVIIGPDEETLSAVHSLFPDF